MGIETVTSRIALGLVCVIISSCGGSARQVPVKEVPVESSEPAVQAYAVEETEISGAEIIGADLQLEESGSSSELPDRTLLGEFSDGIPAFLSDYGNRTVLVNYWTSRCDACGQIATQLEQLYKEYGPRGLVILHVNYGETLQTVEAYRRARPSASGLTQLTDPSGQAAQGVGVLRVPAAVLFQSQSEVSRYTDTISIERIKQDLDLLL